MNEKINLQDLSALLAEKADITKKEAETFLREYFEVMSEELINDNLLKIRDLGTFKLLKVEDRESIDVTTGERFIIPAHYKVSFTPDRKLAEAVNEPFALFDTIEMDDESIPEDLKQSPEENTTNEPEPAFEEEDEFELEKEMILAEEDEPVFEKEKIPEEEEKTVPENEPVSEEFTTDAVLTKYCHNCYDYRAHIKYRAKYIYVQKQLNWLRAITVILAVSLALSVGYIIHLFYF